MTFPPLRTKDQRDACALVAGAICTVAADVMRSYGDAPLGMSVLVAGFAMAAKEIDKKLAPGFAAKAASSAPGSLYGMTTVSRANAAGMPALSGCPWVRAPEPAFTRRESE